MRTSHATPELCPPPAASADLARRRLLTAVAAAPVAVALPAAAERLSDDADAPLFEMLRQVEARRAEFERLWEEERLARDGISSSILTPDELILLDKMEISHKYEDVRWKLLEENSNTINDINEYQPKTIQGVLGKMRLFYKEHSNVFLAPPETLADSAHIFIAALADFERLASVRAS